MAEGGELTLGVLFAGRVDATFRRESQRLRDTLNSLSRRMSGVQSQSDKTRRSARGMGDEFSNVGKKISKVQGGFQRLTAAMKVTASYGLAGTLLFGVIRSLKQGAIEIANFDQALKNLQAITGATDSEIGALSDTVLDIAAKTRYSAGEISEAAVTIGQAGFSAAESLDVLRAVANLSTGTLSSMATTSDLLTTALRAFGENAQQSGRFSDVFASAVNKSKLTIDKLRIAFNYLGPIANQVGLDIENTAAATMVLANAGLRGSTIGTGFRRVLQLLVDPTKKLKVLFASAGADLNKLNPAVASMSDIIGELGKLLGSTVDPAERARRAFELFGLRGSSVAAALGQAGREGFEAMLKEVYRVGVASRMAEKQMEGLAVMAKNLKDRMVNLAIAIGEGGIADAFRLVLPILRTFVGLITDLANTTIGRMVVAFTTLMGVLSLVRLSLKYLLVQMTAVAAGTSIAVIQRYASAHGLLAVAATGASRAIRRLYLLLKTNPWFLLASAVSAVVVALYTYRRSQREIVPNLQKEGIKIDQNILKLKGYKESLDKAREGSVKYRSVLERLVQEYPELANKIDLINGKFLDQGEALKELIAKYNTLRLQNLVETFSEVSDQIKSLERNIANLEYSLVRNKNERLFVRRYTDELNKLKKELKDLRDTQVSSFSRVARVLLDSGLTINSSFEDIRDKIIEVFGVGVKEAENLARYVDQYYDKIKRTNEEAVKNAISLKEAQERLLGSFGDKWLALYRKLSDLRKADLVETIFDMQTKVEKMEETANRQGWTEEQLQARIKSLNNDTYRNFIEKESAKEIKARKVTAAIRDAYFKSNKDLERAEIEAAKSRSKDLSQRVKESVDAANKRGRLLLQIEEALEKNITNIKEKYKRKREDLLDDIKEYEVKSRGETLEAEEEAAKQSAESYRRRIIDEISDAELRRELLISIETALQNDLERIRRKYADKDRGSRKEKILSLEEEYRAGLISAQQYYNELDRLLEDHLLSERQVAKQRMKIQESLWKAFTNGLIVSARDIKSWSEVVYDLGTQVSEKLSSEITDAFSEVVEGTKNWSEAFGVAAIDILKWLTQIILKQTILKSLQDAIFSNFGVTGSSGSGRSPAIVTHKGGIIGRDSFPTRKLDISSFFNIPKLHNGLRRDEFPAILQRGEEVIPKDRVGKNDQDIQVIVNEAPQGTKVSQDLSMPNLRKIIIDVGVSDITSGGRMDRVLKNTYRLGRATVTR